MSHLDRRGAMLPLIALLLPVMIVFLGFSVDLAHMQNVRMELRASTDAAARAAATKLSQTDDATEARNAAKASARQNKVAGAQLRLRNSDIQIGRSERDGSGKWVFRVGATPANSVRVNGERTASSLSGAVPLYFGSLVSAENFQPKQTATATFLNVDICLVLDRSTSMKVPLDSGEAGLYTSDPRFCSPVGPTTKWKSLHDAVALFIDTLEETRAEEHVALSTFSSAYSPAIYCGTSNKAATLNAALDKDLSKVDSAMNSLLTSVWNGNTDIESGMRVGLAALTDTSKARKSADKVMIVMTDGAENVGSSINAAEDCLAESIRVHTITFGQYADKDRMKSVAEIGGGRHFHAADGAALLAAFKELAAQVSQLTE